MGAVVGTVNVYPTIRGTAVTLTGTFIGLPPDTHAVHIHTVGKCEPRDFASAGLAHHRFGSASLLTASWSLAMKVS